MSMLAPALLALAQMPPANAEPPPSRGTVSIEADQQQDLSPEVVDVFDRAVEQALSGADFTVLDAPGHSRFIARFHVSHDARGLVGTPAPGGKARLDLFSLYVPLPSRKTQLRGLYVTSLAIEIMRRGNARPIWRATALTVQPEGMAAGEAAAVAQKLAAALIAQYPAKLETPISVP